MYAPCRSVRGFTLIEMLITVSIIAIIAAVAIPSYQEQIRKTRRAEGRQELMRLATAQERYYTNCNRYAMVLDGDQTMCAGLGRGLATLTSEHGYYVVTLGGDGSNYTLTATPQNDQANDTKCGTLSLNDAGTKGATGTLGVAGCW